MKKYPNEGFDFIEDFSSSDYESVSETDIPGGETRESLQY